MKKTKRGVPQKGDAVEVSVQGYWLRAVVTTSPEYMPGSAGDEIDTGGIFCLALLKATGEVSSLSSAMYVESPEWRRPRRDFDVQAVR